jgi:hypothetical protein
MRRRLTASCKGLLEANISSYEASWETNVSYLHRTVKDFLDQEDVWGKICEGAGSAFDPHAGLFDAELMRVKSSEFSRTEPNLIWKAILPAIFHATRAESCGSAQQIRMLNELDRAIGEYTQPANERDETGLSPKSYFEDWHRRGTDQTSSFLDLAVRLHLVGYVRASLSPEVMPIQSSEYDAYHLLNTAMADYQVAEIYGIEVLEALRRKSRSAAMIQLLLQHASPAQHGSHGSILSSQLPNADVVFETQKFFIESKALDGMRRPFHMEKHMLDRLEKERLKNNDEGKLDGESRPKPHFQKAIGIPIRPSTRSRAETDRNSFAIGSPLPAFQLTTIEIWLPDASATTTEWEV